MRHDASRRALLRAISGLAAASTSVPRMSLPLAVQLAGLGALASQSSHAADTSGGYKALVCLYLSGGSDTHNWVVPIDATGYAEYSAARGELAWPMAKLQAITATTQASGRLFGMPAELAPLRRWYESGQAAVVANVGPLTRPTTKADYAAGIGLPSKLYSHNDQASTWQSLSPEGARSGWGGRMGDILMSANANPVFTAVSATGNAVFLSGNSVTQYQVGVDGPASAVALASGSLYGTTSATAALRRNIGTSGTDMLANEYNRVLQRGLSANGVLQQALVSVNVPAIPATPFTMGNGTTSSLDKLPLARQLRIVLQMMAANQGLGMRRQVFMVSMGGFDTHANQMREQPVHMALVAHAIDYFMTAVTSLGMINNVRLFTASDFGRTLLSNGNGSDHGWGSHHFVLGGGVAGRNIHGQFPTTALGSSDDVGSGRLLPSTSVTELAANLGQWMGLNSSELASVLPNLGAFNRRLSL